MERMTIKAEKRASRGKGSARSLRRQEVIPAVLYRAGGSLPIQIPKSELARFIHQTAGEQVIVNLVFADGENRLAMMKEYQVDPVRRELLHTDFFEVSMEETVRTTVAIHLLGEPIGVKRDGGILQNVTTEIDIECLPDKMPGHIDVNVASLAAGDSLHVSDLRLPEDIKVLTPGKEVIVLVTAPSVAEEAAAPAQPAEPEVVKKGKAEQEK